jgi:hypothetical protein
MLRRTTKQDWTKIRDLLSTAGLPTVDVGEGRASFVVFDVEGTISGTGAHL